ncbi:MAG: riboflavin synthase [Bacteroidota bacterium]
MFTGIIENSGLIKEVATAGSNKSFWIQSPLSPQFSVDQSVAHNGICLTVEEVFNDIHKVTAIAETIDKTTAGSWKPGDVINLERCLLPSSRLDGHFVQGHVDTTAVCKKMVDRDGSFEYSFKFPKKFAALLIEKGSVCINGVSLTVFDVDKSSFTVGIVPYTFQNTNLRFLVEGGEVNIEFDMIGKYIQRKLSLS